MNRRGYSNGDCPQCRRRAGFISCFLLLMLFSSTVTAGISFEDVSERSGISHPFSTAASAWGDMNGDGWPDIWVSNHWHEPPSLYLNNKDGTFTDVALGALSEELHVDFHGAAWADFDNDGDQDLIVITGGGAGRGSCPNYLFVNDGRKLRNEAGPLGVDYPLGRGRTPLWFDADFDGKLDLLVTNKPRHKEKASSTIFLQTSKGFVPGNDRFGFKPSGPRSRYEKLENLFDNAMNLRWRQGPGNITVTDGFAQLAELSGDRTIDLASYMKPMRIYSTGSIPFQEITNDIGFPSIGAVQDIAIEDFNGDLRLDMFLVRSHLGKGVTQVDPQRLQGRIVAGRDGDVPAVHFRSRGEVLVTLFTPWVDPSTPQQKKAFVHVGGQSPLPIDGRTIRLVPQDPSLQAAAGTMSATGVVIVYDPAGGIWKLHSFLPEINFMAVAAKPIDAVRTIGFKSSRGDLVDYLLIQASEGYKPDMSSGLSGSPSPCSSVTAGDFDNDMDIDLYLVCAGATENLPNRLFENNGKGRFVEVPDAGGAKGSNLGKGNQVVSADYDRDGFIDLFVTNGAGQLPFSHEGPHQLFHNKGNTNHWLEIDLQGTVSNRDAIGTQVELEAGGVTQIRNQGGGMHSFSQNHQRLHFGLGPNTKIERIVIRWPSDELQELRDIDVDQILHITEPLPAR